MEEHADGFVRAPWVDCRINPKKHGEFEGHLRGEPRNIRRFLWTGRRWMYWQRGFGRKKGCWKTSIFGEPGDKWRGLAEDPNLQLIAKAGVGCEDEGCPHYGTEHSHATGGNPDHSVLSETVPVVASAEGCECDMRTKLVGDGCKTCNPEKAADYAQDATDTEAGVAVAA